MSTSKKTPSHPLLLTSRWVWTAPGEEVPYLRMRWLPWIEGEPWEELNRESLGGNTLGSWGNECLHAERVLDSASHLLYLGP